MARLLIFAALGWLGLAPLSASYSQEPKAAEEGKQAQPQGEISNAAAAVASAIRESNKPTEADPGCNESEDNRKSDLCAQWKAADAANKAANWAAWSTLVGVVGAVLLVWTLWETRSTARRELRAYVSVLPNKLLTYSIKANPSVEITLTNGGSTPAYDLVHYGNIAVREMPLESDPLANFSGQWIGTRSPFVLHAGQTTHGAIDGTMPITEEQYKSIEDGTAGLYLVGNAEYRDTFGKKRRTEFCFCLTGEAFAETARLAKANPGKLVPLNWHIANLHNDAT